jgi:hypothetical protein
MEQNLYSKGQVTCVSFDSMFNKKNRNPVEKAEMKKKKPR